MKKILTLVTLVATTLLSGPVSAAPGEQKTLAPGKYVVSLSRPLGGGCASEYNMVKSNQSNPGQNPIIVLAFGNSVRCDGMCPMACQMGPDSAQIYFETYAPTRVIISDEDGKFVQVQKAKLK